MVHHTLLVYVMFQMQEAKYSLNYFYVLFCRKKRPARLKSLATKKVVNRKKMLALTGWLKTLLTWGGGGYHCYSANVNTSHLLKLAHSLTLPG